MLQLVLQCGTFRKNVTAI